MSDSYSGNSALGSLPFSSESEETNIIQADIDESVGSQMEESSSGEVSIISYVDIEEVIFNGNYNESHKSNKSNKSNDSSKYISSESKSNSLRSLCSESSDVTKTKISISSVDLSFRPSMLSSSLLSDENYDASLTTKPPDFSIDAISSCTSDYDHPSTSFFNVGSQLLASNHHHHSIHPTVQLCAQLDMDMDASTALAIAMQSQSQNQLQSHPISSHDSSNTTTYPFPPKLTEKSLKEEYTCQLCNKIIVGASILDCASGGSHAFCTLCIETHENATLSHETFDYKDGWVLLSNKYQKDEPIYNDHTNDHTSDYQKDKTHKNYNSKKQNKIISILSGILVPPATPPTHDSNNNNQSNHNNNKYCPVCNESYTRHVPCRSLDVAIFNFIHQNSSMQNSTLTITSNTSETHQVTTQEQQDYFQRIQQWTTEVQNRRTHLQQLRINQVIQAQEQELALYKRRKDNIWKDILGTATTTLAMIFFSTLVASRSNRQG